MTAPSVPFSVWIWAALDPVLLVAAAWLGWRADQAGKIFVAAIAALGVALVVDALVSALGLPWFAPFSQGGPTLLPVRSVTAVAVAAAAYATRRVLRPG